MKLQGDSEGIQTHQSESPRMYLNSSRATANMHSSNGSTSSSDDQDSLSPLTLKNCINPQRFIMSKDTDNETSLDLPAEGEFLEYTEEGHPSFVLAGINSLRKQGQFCDISLVVEDHEFTVHRAVLATCSPYLFDFLSCLEETAESQPTYKLKEVSYDGFHYLLDYMYTGRLHVPLGMVPVVYATAIVLKMESATSACANFLSKNLTPANCLGIRRITKDKIFKQAVDVYIRSNLGDIMNSKSFYGLQTLQVEVVGLDDRITDETMERRMFSLVVDWVKNSLNDLKPKLDRLVEKVNVLYLESDNTLRDCAEVEDTVLSSDDDVVQDYKILSRRRSKTPSKNGNGSQRVVANGNGAQPFHKFSLNPEESVSKAEREWSIVATRKTSENAYLAVALLDGRLMVITVHVRLPVANEVDTNGSSAVPDSPPITTTAATSSIIKSRLSPVLRKASIIPIAGMSSARCAMGAVELDGKLVVCGGYDRGECLQTVEAFKLKENVWEKMPPMNRARARFGATVLGGCVYVCGGSDGWKEQSCVEKFDPAIQKWKYIPNMLKERSSHGVATLNSKLYVVGGCEGQRSIATCEVYDPNTNKWTRIASLNTARSQTCVCAVNGLLFAIGGTDLWNTLNTVEIYDPEKDEWVFGSQLNIARRGAGVCITDGYMVVAGGSDGAQSLVCTEIFNFETNNWTVGPPLNTPRANLSVITVGKHLYAVGGFSGKKFLTTLEWLDTDNMEWFGHTPRSSVEDEAKNFNVADLAPLRGSGAAANGESAAGVDAREEEEEEEGDNGSSGQEESVRVQDSGAGGDAGREAQEEEGKMEEALS